LIRVYLVVGMVLNTSAMAMVARELYEPLLSKLNSELWQLADKCKAFQSLYYRLLAQIKKGNVRATKATTRRELAYYRKICEIVENYGDEEDAFTGMLQMTLDEWSLHL